MTTECHWLKPDPPLSENRKSVSTICSYYRKKGKKGWTHELVRELLLLIDKKCRSKDGFFVNLTNDVNLLIRNAKIVSNIKSLMKTCQIRLDNFDFFDIIEPHQRLGKAGRELITKANVRMLSQLDDSELSEFINREWGTDNRFTVRKIENNKYILTEVY